MSSPALQPTPPAGLLHGPEGRPGAWQRLHLQEDAGLSALPGVGVASAPSLLRPGHSASPGVPSAGVLCACFIRKQDRALWRLEKDERGPPLPGPSPPGGRPDRAPPGGHRQTEAPGPRRTGRRSAPSAGFLGAGCGGRGSGVFSYSLLVVAEATLQSKGNSRQNGEKPRMLRP